MLSQHIAFKQAVNNTYPYDQSVQWTQQEVWSRLLLNGDFWFELMRDN